ncbi:hypothetical protein PFICI_03273 [Pestalotiopsis fici W106-1]|uniref:Extracellular membrane protein CFEM domain-containing protein n=1 Tax=Pestalotiopsis fici (strain W106-1 / CGMCC3.15140) TaxID=1229662 RepID=W3XGQ4_PESFW|nr:uncharacterized protein PFICI_03273 [Pestalotiopsis fici W106-1]ETS85248.1 hypothetical protein PFICI_03273 [Pestalotiopsis fici W106-1]
MRFSILSAAFACGLAVLASPTARSADLAAADEMPALAKRVGDCTQCFLQGTNYVCWCRTRGGDMAQTALDLNKCVTNNNGILRAAEK